MSIAPIVARTLYDEAKQLAEDGYGWADIVVRSRGIIAEETAKQLVLEAEQRRQQREASE